MPGKFFVDNEVVKKIEGADTYDKFAIASTLFDVSFKGSKCSILEAGMINSCRYCNLEPICKLVNELVNNYIDETTAVIEEFNFKDPGPENLK